MELTTSWMERGLEQERRSSISSLMELRYGSITSGASEAIDERLLAILPALMALTSPEYIPLVLQLSKQELIEHFRSAQN